MSWIDGLIILCFILYALGSGFLNKGKASKNLEEYFLAGRSLSGWKAGFSMAATQFASDTPLLVTGLIATGGLFALWQLWVYALAFLLLGFLLAPCWRRASVLTDAELTEFRYGNKPAAVLRIFKAIYLGTIFNCTVLAMVMFAATRIAEPFLLWDLWLPDFVFQPFVSMVESVGIPLTLYADPSDPQVWIRSASNFVSVLAIVLVTFAYSATGGLRAVVATDVSQFAIMLTATFAYALFAVQKVGGLDKLSQGIQDLFAQGGPGGISAEQILAFTPGEAYNVTSPLLMVFALQWLIQMNSDGTGPLAQRTMACRTDRDAKIAAVVFSGTQIVVRSLLWLLIGLSLLVIFPPDLNMSLEILRGEREATFVTGISNLLPVGIKGIMITGMLAALASTVDTHLNWGASYWTNDIYKRFICPIWLKKEASNRELVWVARMSTFLILLTALAIGTQLDSIQETWQISLLLGAGTGIPLILRWVWWRMTAWAEIAAIICSLVLAPLLFFLVEEHALRLLLIAIGCTAGSILAIFIMGPEDHEHVSQFYKTVKPPGFWGPFSKGQQRADQKKLYRGLMTTMACALSMFCILVGLGTWMIGSPTPSFISSHFLWVTVLLAVGIGLIPLWWKMGVSLKRGIREHFLAKSSYCF